MEGKYLITTDAWFTGPDGAEYKAVWGDVTILGDNILGIKTNARSSNWYAKVGSDDDHVIIAGCQIHYAVKCEEKPNSAVGKGWDVVDGEAKPFTHPTKIYITE